jgi:hypothetical protein
MPGKYQDIMEVLQKKQRGRLAGHVSATASAYISFFGSKDLILTEGKKKY